MTSPADANKGRTRSAYLIYAVVSLVVWAFLFAVSLGVALVITRWGPLRLADTGVLDFWHPGGLISDHAISDQLIPIIVIINSLGFIASLYLISLLTAKIFDYRNVAYTSRWNFLPAYVIGYLFTVLTSSAVVYLCVAYFDKVSPRLLLVLFIIFYFALGGLLLSWSSAWKKAGAKLFSIILTAACVLTVTFLSFILSTALLPDNTPLPAPKHLYIENDDISLDVPLAAGIKWRGSILSAGAPQIAEPYSSASRVGKSYNNSQEYKQIIRGYGLGQNFKHCYITVMLEEMEGPYYTKISRLSKRHKPGIQETVDRDKPSNWDPRDLNLSGADERGVSPTLFRAFLGTREQGSLQEVLSNEVDKGKSYKALTASITPNKKQIIIPGLLGSQSGQYSLFIFKQVTPQLSAVFSIGAEIWDASPASCQGTDRMAAQLALKRVVIKVIEGSKFHLKDPVNVRSNRQTPKDRFGDPLPKPPPAPTTGWSEKLGDLADQGLVKLRRLWNGEGLGGSEDDIAARDAAAAARYAAVNRLKLQKLLTEINKTTVSNAQWQDRGAVAEWKKKKEKK